MIVLTESQNKAKLVKCLPFNELSFLRPFFFGGGERVGEGVSCFWPWLCDPNCSSIPETRASWRQNCVEGGLLSLILFVCLSLFSIISLIYYYSKFYVGDPFFSMQASLPFNSNPCPRSQCPHVASRHPWILNFFNLFLIKINQSNILPPEGLC